MVTGIVRKLGIALVVSVTLNLFLLGAYVMHWIHRPPDGPPHHGRPGMLGPPMLFRAGEALGERGHARMRELMHEHRHELIAHKRGLRAARSEIRKALEAEPFERERLAKALEGLRRQTDDSQRALHRGLLDLAEDLTPEERRRLAAFAGMPPRGGAP